VFGSVNGLPLHPLATHAAVVLIPLAGFLGLLFAVPRTRAWATLPLPLVSVLAAVATFVSVQSGEALERVGGVGAAGLGGPVAVLVDQHARLADQLHVLVWVYAGVALLAAVLRRRSQGDSRPVTALAAVLAVGAVVLGVQAYRVGEVGARAVWNPSGAVDYSVPR
jgi:hypothetical protein